MTAPRCTCQWADDEGNLDRGPDPYIDVVDEQCPEHGRAANPEEWAASDAIDAAYAAWMAS